MSSATNDASPSRHTIGLRLTLWGAGITLIVCLLLCMILYTGMFFSLRNEVDGFLEGEIHEFSAVLGAHANDLPGVQREIRSELGSRTRHDLIFRLLDERGHLILSSDPQDDMPAALPDPKAARLSPQSVVFATVHPRSMDYDVRVGTLQIWRGDGSPGIIQAAYVLERMTRSLGLLRQTCAVSLVCAALIALLGGWILAQRCLRPVAVLAANAQSYSVKRLSDRLPLSGTGDELDQLAQTLNDMLARIEDQVRQIQQFTADASHELRSPIAALRGSTEVALSRERSAEELRQVLEENIEHFIRLGRLAEELLLLARADAGRLALTTDTIRLEEAVEDVVDLYAPLAHENNIELTHEPFEPIQIKADGQRIRQVFGNILDNAIKYIGEGRNITVSMSRDNGCACVRFADDGMGIPPNDLPRVFDRFYRVDKSRTAKIASGAGLGLSICRTIVEAHGGDIGMESTSGRGTTVTVKLPLAQQNSARAATAQPVRSA